MAIKGPKTIAAASLRPKHSGGWKGVALLFREECRLPSGEESQSEPLRPRQSRRQPILGQIRPDEETVWDDWERMGVRESAVQGLNEDGSIAQRYTCATANQLVVTITWNYE